MTAPLRAARRTRRRIGGRTPKRLEPATERHGADMVSIDASALRSEIAGAEKTATGKLAALSSWKERLSQPQDQTAQGFTQDATLAALDRKLTSFESALDGFQWPEKDFPWRNARLTAKDPALSGKLAVAVTPDGGLTQFYKFYSRGVELDKPHGLANKTYPLTLTLGGGSQTFRITLDDQSKTWGDVFEKVGQAVNDSGLKVQASVLTQAGVGQRESDLVRTGHVLALSVDRGYENQNLQINRAQQLAYSLDFQATSNPMNTTATKGATNVQALQRASPTTLYSSNFDPRAAATLEPGAYYATYGLGANVSALRIDVKEGDMWGDLLQRAATAIEGSSSGVKTVVESPNVPTYDMQGQALETRAQRIAVWAAAPKVGERLQFGQGQADASATFYDPNSSEFLPIGEQGQVYIATESGNGWTKDMVYTYRGSPYQWIESAPNQGDVNYIQAQDENYRYDAGAGWHVSQDLLETLGLGPTAFPGADAKLAAEGKTRSSSTGVFGLDQGRVLVDAQIPFAENLPVYVLDGLNRLGTQLNEVVSAYNGLQDFLNQDQSQWKPTFASSWSEPVSLLQGGLNWLGITGLGSQKLLWANGDTFAQALHQDPDRARATLNGNTQISGALLTATLPGLIPSWRALAAQTRSKGLETTLANPANASHGAATTTGTATAAKSTPPPTTATSPPWRRNLDNEEARTLLDLYG